MKIKIASIIVVFALIFNMVPLNVFAAKEMMDNPLFGDGRDRLYSKILRKSVVKMSLYQYMISLK